MVFKTGRKLEIENRDFIPLVPEVPVKIEPTERERNCASNLIRILSLLKPVISQSREGTDIPISLQQFSVLKILDDHEYMISELADRFKVSRPTMTRMVDGLEGRRRNPHSAGGETENSGEDRPKLVERLDSPSDRRLVYARITSEGSNVLKKYCEKAEENVSLVLRRIPPEELPQLEHSIHVLRKALEEEF